LTDPDKSYRTTEAAAFELLDRAAHDPILLAGLWPSWRSQKRSRLPLFHARVAGWQNHTFIA
jgi:hypothetical protein